MAPVRGATLAIPQNGVVVFVTSLAFASVPFWSIGLIFFIAAVDAAAALCRIYKGRSALRLGPVSALFFLCMLFAAGFFYFAAFLLMKGLPL